MAQLRTRESQLQTNKKKEDEKDTEDDAVVLKRQLNLFFCITIIVGITIGSGIFISPKGVLVNTKSVGMSLVVWASCGILVMFGGLIYAELGTTFGKSGGDYVYINEVFGPLPAFLVVWTVIVISTPATASILSITFATYLTKPFFPECETPKTVVTLVAIACLMVVYFVNSLKVKAAAQTQNIFAVAKVTGLIMIIIGGIVQLFRGKTEYLKNDFEEGTGSVLDISLAFYSALFAYGGMNNANMLTEEIQNPSRNLPIAVVVAEVTITLIYVSTNIAYLTVMSGDELLASDAVALTFADKILGSFSWIIPVIVAISIYGSLNGGTLSRTRLCFVCARDGYLPDILSMIHIKYKTPLPSLLAMEILSVFVVIVSSFAGDTIYQLLNFTSISSWLIPCGSTASLLYLRWKRPDIPRPFKVPIIIPVIFFIWVMFLEVTGVIAAPVEGGIGIAIILSGVPVYYFGKWKNKPRSFMNFTGGISRFLQRYLLVVKQEKETF
ncbi:cystine/glutamate transporter-like [Glandiceps talaboti]